MISAPDLKILKNDFKFFGPEPKITEKSISSDIIIAYNWYNYICSNDDAKKFVISYLESKKAKKLIILIEQIDSWLLRNIGWNLRIKMRGGILPKELENKVFDKLDVLLKAQELKNKTRKPADPNKPVVSVQDRINSKVAEIIGDFETELDKFAMTGTTEFVPSTYIKINDVKPLIAKRISMYYEDLAKEIIETISGKDPDLKQAYRYWTRAKLKRYLDLINTIIAVGIKEKVEVKKTKGKKKNAKRTKRN